MAPVLESNSAPATPPEVIAKYKEILLTNGISDLVAEVVVNESGLKGENIGSLIKYVTIIFEDHRKMPLHLFVKTPTMNKMLEEWQLFQKESMFFMEYLPVAREYCRSMGQEELMNMYPKCYYGDDKLVVLENLVLGRGYTLLSKEELQDFETAKLVLTNLAKHDAISHAVIKKYGGPKPFFERFPKLNFESLVSEASRQFLNSCLDSAVDTNLKILVKCDIEGKEEAIQKLKAMKGKHFEEMLGAVQSKEARFLVLNHGHYWNNNMMFLKDKESSKVVDQVAIDFQVVRYASPCVDIAYYLFTSVKPEVRQSQLKELLAVYAEALKVTANELGHPIELSQQDLEADYCKHFIYGFWFGLMTTCQAGYAVRKDVEMDEKDDIADWAKKLDKLVGKWIDDHPEECKGDAENTVQYLKEGIRLTRGIINNHVMRRNCRNMDV